MTTIAAVFAQLPLTAGVALRKAMVDVAPNPTAPIPGSYEHFIDKARAAVVNATPCPRDSGAAYHYPHVRATFADHALVGCDTCAKTWHVPFAIDDDNVIKAGAPSERVARYVDPDASDDDDADDDDSDAADDSDADAAGNSGGAAT